MTRLGVQVLLLIAVWATSEPLRAQPREVFGHIDFSAGIATNSNTTLLHQFWTADTGLEVRASTPFHVGYLSAGVRSVPYDPREAVPAFDGTLFYGGWGLQWDYASRTSLSVGARLGNLRMVFDSEAQSGVRIESELTLGLETLLRLQLTNRSALIAGWSFERTFTRIRMNLRYITVGYAFRLTTPDWLKGFLR